MAVLKETINNSPYELKRFYLEKLQPLEDELLLAEENQKQENKTCQ